MQQEVATPAARTNLAPIPMECDAPHLEVVGELPRELNGTLYRNGPNPQFDAPGAHWFVGDGMLHAFHLENGRASYRNRWVRTPKWQAEHDAGRALCGGFGRKLPDAPASTTQDGGVANTNIIFHAGRLLALEEGHLPTEIEPGTLNRRGYCDYDGAIAGPFTAHPKIDPATGEMVFFGYNAAGPLTPALSFGSVNASGVVTRFDRLTAPYASYVHDFIVTEHHLLSRPKLLRVPRHERLGRRHAHHRRRHAVRRAAIVHPSQWFAHRSKEVAGTAVPLDLRSRRQYRPFHANLSRRCHRRIPAHRRSPRRSCQRPRLVRLRQSRPDGDRHVVRRGARRRHGLARRPVPAAGGRYH